MGSMYHFPNQPIVHHGYQQQQQCSFFGPIGGEPAAEAQKNEPASHASHVPTSSQPLVDRLAEKGAQTVKEGGKAKAQGKGAKKEVVDTSTFSVEQRVVAAVWVHERHHAHSSMGQIKEQFLQRFGRAPPAKNTLLAWERKLFAAGAVHDAPRPGRPAKRKLLVSEVRASLRAAPALSVRARAAALRVPRSTLRALLGRELRARAAPPVKKKAPRKPRPAPAPPAPPPPPAPAVGFT